MLYYFLIKHGTYLRYYFVHEVITLILRFVMFDYSSKVHNSARSHGMGKNEHFAMFALINTL